MPLVLLLGTAKAVGDATNVAALSSSLPDTGLSLLRVMGSLALVLGIFLGGVWLFRNWQRLAIQKGRAPKLNILEARSLGQRHALYVIGFEDQRFLIASSPTGVNLLSHLPNGEALPADNSTAPATPVSFGQVLNQLLVRR